MQRIIFNFLLAIEAVLANRLRAFLTALGIIFGVAAVIAMLAIGTGAKQSILEQMKLIGTNNIVVESMIPEEEDNEAENSSKSKDKKKYSPGLTLKDALSIEAVLPTVETVSPEIVLSTSIIQSGKIQRGRVVGITNAFFDLNNIQLDKGQYFHNQHFESGRPVCIIGENIKNKFFSEEKAVGKFIKCGNTWLKIIGVLKRRFASKDNLSKLGIRDYNSDVYIPVQTALLRFKNRSLVTKKALKAGYNEDDDDDASVSELKSLNNYHQLDRLVVRIANSDKLQASASVIARMLNRRHEAVEDYNIKVPELLLQQQQKTQETFNFVLAVIAGISLLVGGIGIMNIMLASVLERIKEIGVRRSLGAKRQDIILQFLFESVTISLIGGLIGVFLGIFAAQTIAQAADIPTIVSTWSIVLSFGVSMTVGLVFGIIPARRAALLDPIKALRND